MTHAIPRNRAERRKGIADLCQKLTLVMCSLVLLGALDGMQAGFRTDKTMFCVVRGEETLVSGDLYIPPGEQGVRVHAEAENSAPGTNLDGYIRYSTTAPGLSMHFIEIKGRLWRGLLRVSDSAALGDARLDVFLRGCPPEELAPYHTVRIVPDRAALAASQLSLFRRIFGVEPWWVMLGAMPLAALCGLAVFREKGREMNRLLANGVAPIYKLARRGDHWEVVFGLGTNHGVREGDTLAILDRNLAPVGSLTAHTVQNEISHANVDMRTKIAPSFFVALRN
ncbi:hypothetical protein GGQ74_001729 [Desulfobaculum xiamenense]|uniref:Uncharacterized protein n=1 Tax=Desulfobaculum xiamenense TaxID=995050 RepID=A0A846QGW6_9BACT|nr:hypothetical protein [Desulfobaculum xiamenense]NJB68056.1 hypothetical protein [Desulfobaculum xiamenense]